VSRTESRDIVAELTSVLRQRRKGDPQSSYVAGLYAAGLNKILEKVAEESTEVLLAARDLRDPSIPAGNPALDTKALKNALANEVADLWFHTMVLLTECDIHPQQVLDILDGRFGVSGIEEKRNR